MCRPNLAHSELTRRVALLSDGHGLKDPNHLPIRVMILASYSSHSFICELGIPCRTASCPVEDDEANYRPDSFSFRVLSRGRTRCQVQKWEGKLGN